MSSDEKKMEGADKPTEDDGAKKAVADTDDDEDRVCGFDFRHFFSLLNALRKLLEPTDNSSRTKDYQVV